jgi:hypothetical protein
MVALHELRNHLGDVLQISIHHARGVSQDMVERGRQSRLMPEISRKRDGPNAGVLLRSPLPGG